MELFLRCWFERIVGSAALLREVVFKIFFEMLFPGPGFWSVSGSFAVTWLSQKGGSGRWWRRCCWCLWPSKAALQCLSVVSNSQFFGSSNVQKLVLHLYFAFYWVFSPPLLTHLDVCTCHWSPLLLSSVAQWGRTFSECNQLNQAEFWKEELSNC